MNLPNRCGRTKCPLALDLGAFTLGDRTWFSCFAVPDEADFIVLFGSYAPDRAQTKRIRPTWYRDCTLLFTKEEMRGFMANCLTRAGQPDRMFGFGFDDPRAVFQTRGDQNRRLRDFSDHLLETRLPLLKSVLDGEPLPQKQN
jgi:hypothetical protein